MKLAVTKNIPALIAVIATGVLGLADLLNWRNLGEQIGWINDPMSGPYLATNLAFLISTAIAIVGAGLVVALAFLRFNPVVNLIAIVAVAFVAKVVPNIIWLTQDMNNGLPVDGQLLIKAFIWTDWNEATMTDSVLRFLWWIPIVLAAIAIITGKTNAAAPTAPVANGFAFDPNTGQPISQPAGLSSFASAAAGYQTPQTATSAPVAQDGKPVSSMPLTALILSFIVPVVGLILAYISLNQIKLGQASRVNEGQAKTALIISWVFIGIGMISSVLIGIGYAVMVSNRYGGY